MSGEHHGDCDLVVYGPDAQEVLCTCNLPLSDSGAHPLAKRAWPMRSFVERQRRDGATLESIRRRDLAEKHVGETRWIRVKAWIRLALAAWRLRRQRRRLHRG